VQSIRLLVDEACADGDLRSKGRAIALEFVFSPSSVSVPLQKSPSSGLEASESGCSCNKAILNQLQTQQQLSDVANGPFSGIHCKRCPC